MVFPYRKAPGLAAALLTVAAITVLHHPAPAAGQGQPGQATMTEPDLETAYQWWSELPKKWTAIGWKEHVTRFNVLYDGTLVNYFNFDRGPQADNALTRPQIPEPYTQFTFVPAAVPEHVPAFAPVGRCDYGDVVQGWENCDTPVLWSEWSWGGYLLRNQVFAHVPGGQESKTGMEPLFAWVRLSVHYVPDGLPLEKTIGFGVRINNYTVNYAMDVRGNLSNAGMDPKYPRALKAEPQAYVPGQALRVTEPDGRVRLALAPGTDSMAAFRPGAPSPGDSLLHVQLPPEEGAHVDLLIPMLPTDRETFDRELALGYEGALAEAERFWSRLPDTAAVFDVPEEPLNQIIRRNLQHAQITSEKGPDTENTYVLTGALGYGLATWATPISIALNGLLDPMGYPDLVGKYLKPFKESQGRILPPGDAFRQHPGYLGVPERVAIVHWLPDHGAILWTMAQHGLISGDASYIREYTPVIVKACEWIRDARAILGHGGVEGIMPAAGSSDDESRIQNCWSDGWMYKGLTTAVKFLKRTGHPRAAEFEAEARDYRDAFRKAFRAKAATMPKWVDSAGNERTLVPLAMSGESDWHYRHLFYLDTGPMHLVFAGLMEPDDPLMRDAVDWFREGPPTKLYRKFGDLGHIPSLKHEMSSWEPCYSWNMFSNWKLGDRQRFLEGMYSQFGGAISRQTYTVCESRGGVTGNIFWLPVVYLARLAVIDDQIAEDELHLLRLCPLAWLRTDRAAKFENMPTEFGPVTLRAKLDPTGAEMQVAFSGRFRQRPGRVVLHVPPVSGLKRVTLNGRALPWDGLQEMLVIQP